MLTRLPSGLAVPPALAADTLARRFSDEPLRLSRSGRAALVSNLAGADVFGGASYDGLVALEAARHQQTLVSLDRRAQETYRRLEVPFRTF